MRKEPTNLREENKRLSDMNDELLTALERALDYIEKLRVDETSSIIQQARAAIAKAEGK